MLMLNNINVTKNTCQVVFITATHEAAERTFEQACGLAGKMRIRCGLVKLNVDIDITGFHCVIGTPALMANYFADTNLRLDVRMVLFDDSNKSISFYYYNLLKFGAKYVCVSAVITKHLADICNNQLNVVQVTLPAGSVLSSNLRHVEFPCETQFEKLLVTTELSKWANKMIIFVLVNKIFISKFVRNIFQEEMFYFKIC